MGAQMSTTYDSTAVEQIVQSVFSTMLQIDLTPTSPLELAQADALVTTIQITGQWAGGVVLALSPDLARESAAAMLQVPTGDVTDADLRDVAAELVNMIGGNLKSILPAPSCLSLPTIVSGHDVGVQFHHSHQVDEIFLEAPVGRLSVRVFQKST